MARTAANHRQQANAQCFPEAAFGLFRLRARPICPQMACYRLTNAEPIGVVRRNTRLRLAQASRLLVSASSPKRTSKSARLQKLDLAARSNAQKSASWRDACATRSGPASRATRQNLMRWVIPPGVVALSVSAFAQNVESAQTSDPVSIINQTICPLLSATVLTVTRHPTLARPAVLPLGR